MTQNALRETEKANQKLYFFVSLPLEHAKSNICERKILLYRDTVCNYTQKALSINIKCRKLQRKNAKYF